MLRYNGKVERDLNDKGLIKSPVPLENRQHPVLGKIHGVNFVRNFVICIKQMIENIMED